MHSARFGLACGMGFGALPPLTPPHFDRRTKVLLACRTNAAGMPTGERRLSLTLITQADIDLEAILASPAIPQRKVPPRQVTTPTLPIHCFHTTVALRRASGTVGRATSCRHGQLRVSPLQQKDKRALANRGCIFTVYAFTV
jgi:hypothetical protein